MCAAGGFRRQDRMTRHQECMWPRSEEARGRGGSAEAEAQAEVECCEGSCDTGPGHSPVVGTGVLEGPSCLCAAAGGWVCHQDCCSPWVGEAAGEGQCGRRVCSRAAAAAGGCTDAWLDPGVGRGAVERRAGSAAVCALARGLEGGALALPGDSDGYGEPRLASPNGVNDDGGGELMLLGISGGKRPRPGGMRWERGVGGGGGGGPRQPEGSEVLEMLESDQCRDSLAMTWRQQRAVEGPRMGQRRALSHHDMALQL